MRKVGFLTNNLTKCAQTLRSLSLPLTAKPLCDQVRKKRRSRRRLEAKKFGTVRVSDFVPCAQQPSDGRVACSCRLHSSSSALHGGRNARVMGDSGFQHYSSVTAGGPPCRRTLREGDDDREPARHRLRQEDSAVVATGAARRRVVRKGENPVATVHCGQRHPDAKVC